MPQDTALSDSTQANIYHTNKTQHSPHDDHASLQPQRRPHDSDYRELRHANLQENGGVRITDGHRKSLAERL